MGDWVLVEGAFGYAYGYGQIAIVRPTRLTLVADSNVDIPFNVRRDQVREVFASREDAGMVHQRLKSLQAAQPFQVFTQHHCAGRYRELRSLAEALHTKC